MNTDRVDEGLGALSDGTRRVIVARLADRPQAVGELAAGPPVSRPAVSQHLKVLKDAGLVTERPVGTRRIYRLNPVALAALRDQLNTYWQRSLGGYADLVADDTEEEDDPANASEVEVRFVPEGDGQTRVELEHRHLDRHGTGWEEVRDGIEGEAGWPLYLEKYADLLD